MSDELPKAAAFGMIDPDNGTVLVEDLRMPDGSVYRVSVSTKVGDVVTYGMTANGRPWLIQTLRVDLIEAGRVDPPTPPRITTPSGAKALAIVRDLAAGREPEAVEDEERVCLLCDWPAPPLKDNPHAPTCPYRRAKELMGDE